jgi:hypothetical protein
LRKNKVLNKLLSTFQNDFGRERERGRKMGVDKMQYFFSKQEACLKKLTYVKELM